MPPAKKALALSALRFSNGRTAIERAGTESAGCAPGSGGLQDLELDIAEECKAFVRAGVDGIGLGLQSINTSRQLEYPYGFVVARVDAGAPEATTH